MAEEEDIHVTSLDIKLNNASKTFSVDRPIEGYVVVSCPKVRPHKGLVLRVDGSVTLQPTNRQVGLLDALYSTGKPIKICDMAIDLADPGQFEGGVTEVPFSFHLEPLGANQLYETFHGVCINVTYYLVVELVGGFLAKTVEKAIEFIVLNPLATPPESQEVSFSIQPTAEDLAGDVAIPPFRIVGKMHKDRMSTSEEFSGEFRIEPVEKGGETPTAIRSIELQLMRVETIGTGSIPSVSETTEIQNIQVCDGAIEAGRNVPLWMCFPKLFTCGSCKADMWKIEFEVNLVVLVRGFLFTENFPIVLYSTRKE